MKIYATFFMVFGFFGFKSLAYAELVTDQSAAKIKASLLSIEKNKLDTNTINLLIDQHLAAVAAGKVRGNQSILNLQVIHLNDVSIKDKLIALDEHSLVRSPKKTAQELALPELQLVKKTVNGTQIDSISMEAFNDLAIKVSDTTDTEKWLYVWAPKPEDRKPASREAIAKHKEEIQTILTTVWLKSVAKWDSDIASGKLKPEFYKDLVTFINNGVHNNKFPSVESFRRIVNSSIELARGQNFPDSKLGEKLYERSLPNISDALTNYLLLTQENGYKVVKVQIGELKYSLPALTQETSIVSQKSTQAPSLFVAQLKDTQDQLIASYNHEQDRKNHPDEYAQRDKEFFQDIKDLEKGKAELAQNKAELEKIEIEGKKIEIEGKFLDDANRIQSDLLRDINLYARNPDDETLASMKRTFSELQALNKRAAKEYVNGNPEVLKQLSKVEEKYKTLFVSSNQGKTR